MEGFKEFEQLKAADSQTIDDHTVVTKPKQFTLAETHDRGRVWDVNNPRAQLIHRRIAKMIAVDCQPFSIVQDKGFMQLLKTLEPRYKFI